MQALELAKLAQVKCRSLEKYLVAQELAEFVNTELYFSCSLNLATHFQKNGLTEEAFREYDSLLKASAHPNNFLVRVNLGNLHYQEGEYTAAIKMYKMAVDMVPAHFEQVKFKIHKNVGRCHVQLREFPEAAVVYEDILGQSPDFETAFNLILCLYVLGHKDKMAQAFEQMVQISSADQKPFGTSSASRSPAATARRATKWR